MRVPSMLVAMVGTSGCFSPTLPADVSCAVDLICPDRLFCDPQDFICRDVGGDGDGDGGGDADASSTPLCIDPSVALCLEFEDTTLDGAARSNRVVVVGGPAVFAAGKKGRGLALDGVTYLTVDDYRPGTTTETLELWMTVPANSQYQVALASEIEIEIGARGQTIEASSGQVTVASAALATTELHHVAVVVDGTNFTLYVNGAEISTGGFNDVDPAPEMFLGASTVAADRYVGTIDSVRAWTRALSPSEISAVANAP